MHSRWIVVLLLILLQANAFALTRFEEVQQKFKDEEAKQQLRMINKLNDAKKLACEIELGAYKLNSSDICSLKAEPDSYEKFDRVRKFCKQYFSGSSSNLAKADQEITEITKDVINSAQVLNDRVYDSRTQKRLSQLQERLGGRLLVELQKSKIEKSLLKKMVENFNRLEVATLQNRFRLNFENRNAFAKEVKPGFFVIDYSPTYRLQIQAATQTSSSLDHITAHEVAHALLNPVIQELLKSGQNSKNFRACLDRDFGINNPPPPADPTRNPAYSEAAADLAAVLALTAEPKHSKSLKDWEKYLLGNIYDQCASMDRYSSYTEEDYNYEGKFPSHPHPWNRLVAFASNARVRERLNCAPTEKDQACEF